MFCPTFTRIRTTLPSQILSILLKLDCAKFDVSNLRFSNVIEEKPLGKGEFNPLVKEGLTLNLGEPTRKKLTNKIG